MKFDVQLNEYIKIIGCNGKELAQVSGIPAPIISEYKNGNRLPKYKSKQLENLIKGLVKLSKDKGIDYLNEETIRTSLEKYLDKNNIDFEIFRNNFNSLISKLNINVSDLSKYIGYDSSFISKIRSGIRKPLNLGDFANAVSKYITYKFFETNNTKINQLIKFESLEMKNKNYYCQKIYYWLTNNSYNVKEDYNIDSFFKKLDDFDLNNYIKAIKFDKLIVPTLPRQIFKNKIYYGFDGYKEAQLEVLKQIAFSKSQEGIFWYSNMPIDQASKDLKFMKKYMLYIAFILKKGLTLNIIHDLDRPFKELMIGLEGWIPLYMTGQINPYYFKNNSNLIYSQIECSSENAILHGECITGNLDKVKLIVSNKKEDIAYYNENAKLLLKKANTLMGIYNSNKKENFCKVLDNNLNINGQRRNILHNLPIYTIPDKLLNEILDKSKISKEDKKYIIELIKKEKKNIATILKNNEILDEISIIEETEFKNSKCSLDLSKYFYDKKEILYTYNQYQEHIKSLKDFKKNNKNYNYKINKNNIFKNINIHIINERQIIISKSNLPITHFVIYNKILIDAIKNFNVPIKEK